jgi:hypothetical protein
VKAVVGKERKKMSKKEPPLFGRMKVVVGKEEKENAQKKSPLFGHKRMEKTGAFLAQSSLAKRKDGFFVNGEN